MTNVRRRPQSWRWRSRLEQTSSTEAPTFRISALKSLCIPQPWRYHRRSSPGKSSCALSSLTPTRKPMIWSTRCGDALVDHVFVEGFPRDFDLALVVMAADVDGAFLLAHAG